MNLKEEKLLELAKKRLRTRYDGYTCIGDYDDGVWEEPNYVSPYSKSAHNVDAEVMIVLQDWCSAESFTGEICQETKMLGYTPSVRTNINMIDLLREHLGLALQDTYATNLFPYVKPGVMNAYIPLCDLARAAKDFTLPMIEIIQPKVVLVFGSATYNGLRRACGLPCVKNLEEAINTEFTIGNAVILGQAHTGMLGRNNRNRYGVDRVSGDWERVMKYFVGGGGLSLNELRKNFWKHLFVELSKRNISYFESRSIVAPYNCVWFKLCNPNIYIALVVARKKLRLEVQMYHPEDKALNEKYFMKLHSCKVEIEKEFDVPLKWECKVDKIPCAITAYCEHECYDQPTWPAVVEWLAHYLPKFNNLFHKLSDEKLLAR